MPSTLITTKLSDLIIDFLKSLDAYNSTDLSISGISAGAYTDVDTSGERARRCLNKGLHLIYDLIKDSKYLESYPTTRLSSQEGIDYIELDPETYLDDIEAITDTTNNYKLIKRSWAWYRMNVPNPANATGDPQFYIRRGSRVYLTPRPTSVRTYTIDFRKYTEDLKNNGDQPLLPTHYDYWIISESIQFWKRMEDENYVMVEPPERYIALGSIFSDYDSSSQVGSHMNHDPRYPEMPRRMWNQV